jgi:polysaccharide pyruvyl transferase WcaK-like protein
MSKHKQVEGCESLTYNDRELLGLLKNKNKYKAVIDNDIVWVVDKELEDQDVDNVVVGDFDSYGQDFIMALFEYMNMDAEYC